MKHFHPGGSFFILLIAACLFITSCGSNGSDNNDDTTPAQETPARGAWTYMVYMAADNNISNAANADLNEIESVGSSTGVNIVVQAEFSRIETPALPVSTIRGKVTRDEDLENIGSWYSEIGNKNMTDPETLREFIAWAATNYPADHYALVLWSHGSGWKVEQGSPVFSKGMITDTTSSGSTHLMSLPELAGAVRNSGIVFDLINFDSCLMGMYETAYEFKGLGSYLVFAEDVYPAYGDPYDTVLQALTENPAINGAELAQVTAVKSREFYSSAGISMSKSAVDMSKLDQLNSLISSLAQYLSDNLNAERVNIESARSASVSFNYPEHHDLTDFIGELEQRTSAGALKSLIDQLQAVLSQMVISNEIYSTNPSDAVAGAQGLAIYLPSSTQASQDDLTVYSSLAVNQSSGVTWGDFLNRITTGNQSLGPEAVQGSFAVRLEWDTDADIDLYVCEPDGVFAAPRYGTRSGENGVCSEDSFYSKERVEFYESSEIVAAGSYDIFVNYYGNGATSSGPAKVSCMVRDPLKGVNEYTLVSSRTMDLSNPLPNTGEIDGADIDRILEDSCSNWWYAGSVIRPVMEDETIESSSVGEPPATRVQPEEERKIWFELKKPYSFS